MNVSVSEIESFIIDEVASLTHVDRQSVTPETALIGSGRALDSADLVVLLLAVEDMAGDKLGISWDWTSDSAMSEARSVLRNIGSLAAHLVSLSHG